MVQERKRQLIVKICCVIAAFLLWLYTSNDGNISKTYKISNIPIEIINQDYLIQSGLIISPNQKFTTSLKIAGKPSEIYSVKPEQFKLVADLSAYALKKGENKIPISIIKRPGADINIINDSSLWITVYVDSYVEKSFPVNIDIKGGFKDGFKSQSPIINPGKIIISGAEEYVNSVWKVIAKVDINNSDANFKATIPLKAINKMGQYIDEVTINPKLADIVVPVQKIKKVGINPNIIGKLSNELILKNIKLYKETVIITGDPKKLSSIDKIETEPVDLGSLKDKKSLIKAKLVLPKDIKLVDSSDFVEGEILLDKVLQKSFNPNIEVIGLQKGFSAKLDKTSISLVVSGGETLINSLDKDTVKCYVNLDSSEKGEYTIPINIKLSQGINIVSQNPKFVKVKIEEYKNNNSENVVDKDKGNSESTTTSNESN